MNLFLMLRCAHAPFIAFSFEWKDTLQHKADDNLVLISSSQLRWEEHTRQTKTHTHSLNYNAQKNNFDYQRYCVL